VSGAHRFASSACPLDEKVLRVRESRVATQWDISYSEIRRTSAPQEVDMAKKAKKAKKKTKK
jgi:hypothetical protein